MHMDLNSAFATIEQQANPLLRGKPLVVAAYASPRGCILAASIEAKRLGIKTGMRVGEAKVLYADLLIRTPDPPKYRAVHKAFMQILKNYSPNVVPKSIDEAVIDFTDTLTLFNRDILAIGQEIKNRMRSEIGEWMFCSVGVGPNRFLAKLAASLRKPDGLELIDKDNLQQVYKQIKLIDLTGINIRYQARLNAYGIFTPTQFFSASLEKLQKQVFRGILGYYWYLRLRGWEIDSMDFKRKTFGHSYALGHQTSDPEALSKLLMKLCEKTGRRLRRSCNSASGIHVSCLYTDFSYWHASHKFPIPSYTTNDIYRKAIKLLRLSGFPKTVRELAVRVYDLIPDTSEQMRLFHAPEHAISRSMDQINDTYGEFSVSSGLLIGMQNAIIDRIAFGNVRDI